MGVGLMNLIPRLPVTQSIRGRLPGFALFGAVVIGHGGPVGVAVHQHGDQPAVDQVGPAAVFGVWQMFGDQVHAVAVPAALDVQAMGVAATAAVANAFRRGGVL
ncbi:hypothetical protein GCM10008969_23100 [Pseudomonas veronii subsp. inensis]